MRSLPTLFGGDDRAVSPVIGVILMVAITVILAAVIGTFVLGLGDNLDSQPSAQIAITGDDAEKEITIEHNSGDTVQLDNLDIVLRDGSTTIDRATVSAVDGEDDSSISVGDTVTIDLNDGGDATVDNVRLIHTPSDSIFADRTIDEIDDVNDENDGDAFANGP